MPSHKVKSSTFFGNTFFIFIIRFFPSLASLCVLIFYSRNLSREVYGEYSRFWILLNIIYSVACFGIHSLLLTYSRNQIVSLFKALKTKHIVGYFLWTFVLSFTFVYLNRTTSQNFLFLFLLLIAYSASFILESFLIVTKKFVTLTATSIAYSGIFVYFHYVTVQQGFSINKLYPLVFWAVTFRFVIYSISTFLELKQNRKTEQIEISLSLRNVVSLWLHLGIYDVMQNLFNWIDKLAISLFLSAELSAIYFNGAMNIPFLPILLSAAGSAVLLQLSSLKQSDSSVLSVTLMRQTGKWLSSIVFPLFFFLLFNGKELIVYLFSVKYVQASPVFLVFLFVLPLRAYSFTTVLQKLHKGKIINIGGLADLVIACVLMYPLYQWLGLPGIAFSFVLSTWVQAYFYLYHTARLLQVPIMRLIPLKNWIVKLVLLSIIFGLILLISKQYCWNTVVLLFVGGTLTSVAIFTFFMMEKRNVQQSNF